VNTEGRALELAPEVTVGPPEFPAARRLAELTLEAASHIQLDPSARRLEVFFDAPEFADMGFWTIERAGPGAWSATLYGSPSDVLDPQFVSSGLVLDPKELSRLDDAALDRLRADRWLHRNLLQLDDLIRGRMQPTEVPREVSWALQSVWDVWTDGRLRRQQLPGLTQAERRRIFFRVFARRGVLLPRHWQIFHELWNGDFVDQLGLLDSLRELPQH